MASLPILLSVFRWSQLGSRPTRALSSNFGFVENRFKAPIAPMHRKMSTFTVRTCPYGVANKMSRPLHLDPALI